MAAGETEALVRRVAALEAQLQQLLQIFNVSGNELSIEFNGRINITAGAGLQLTAGGPLTVTAGSQVAVQASTSIDLRAVSTISASSMQGMTLKTGRVKVDISNDAELSVGKDLSVIARDSIGLTTGSAALAMKKDGTVVLGGKDVTLKASGKVNVHASSDVVLKGSKILQN